MVEKIKNIKILLFKSVLGIGFLMAVLLFNRCQEPYFNDALDAQQQIPVFSGLLSNINTINSFELYYAMPYTNQRMQRIPGAIITISDSLNHTVELAEPSPGIYTLPAGNESLPKNQFYVATIQMPDGEILKSQPVYYYDTLPIASTFFDFNIQSSVVKNTSGGYSNVNQEGILVQFKLKQPATEPVYYRANANYYVHSQRWVSRRGEITITSDQWDVVYDIYYDTLYDIYEGITYTDFPLIGELKPYIDYSPADLILNPLFLPADRNCRNFTHYTPDRFIEWVIPIDLYHNSRDIYQYYNNAVEQLTAAGQIFDPIPEQLMGNMYNETDPTRPVLGLFDISSVNRKYLSVYVFESLGYRSYQSKVLEDTIIRQGWYPNSNRTDTVFRDSLPRFK